MAVISINITDAEGGVGTDTAATYTVSISATGSTLAVDLGVTLDEVGSGRKWTGTLTQFVTSSGMWEASLTYAGESSVQAQSSYPSTSSAIASNFTIAILNTATPPVKISNDANVTLDVFE